MSDTISLRKAERQVFSAATQDGLLDVFLGSIFLMFAIAPFLTPSLGDLWSTAVFIPFWATVALAIWLIRRHVVKPRVGVVRFRPARIKRLHKFSVVMLVVNVTAFIIGIWVSYNSELLSGSLTSAKFGLICLVSFSIAAYFLDSRRLYVYGLLLCSSPLIGEWLWVRGIASHHGFPVTFGVTASIMILTGLFVFVRVLRNNPILSEGASKGEE